MSRKRNVVIGSSHLWKGARRVSLHFFSEHFLEMGSSVYFLTVLFSVLLIVNPWYFRPKLRKLCVWLKGREEYRFGSGCLTNYVYLSLFHPSAVIPFLDNYYVARDYLKFSYPPMRRLLREVGPVDVTMFDTGGVSIYGQIPAQLVVYRLSDLVPGFDTVSQGMINYESEILRKADLVLPVSQPLYDYAVRKRGTPEGVHLLPNGVDTDKFSRFYPVPVEYEKIPKPIAIYVGTTDSWFDWDLLSCVAKQKRNVSFVIVGPGYVSAKLPENVYTLGPRPYVDIPAYMQYADVGLIPFKNLPRMDTVERPLKFYQYLASGLPVVSVSHGALRKMAPYAILADDSIEFLRGVDQALEFDKKDRENLRETARGFSWKKIFKQFDEILALYE